MATLKLEEIEKLKNEIINYHHDNHNIKDITLKFNVSDYKIRLKFKEWGILPCKRGRKSPLESLNKDIIIDYYKKYSLNETAKKKI